EHLHHVQGEGDASATQDKENKRHRLSDVVGKYVGDKLPDVIIDGPPFLHRVNNRGEVIVSEDHISSLFGHVGPSAPHGDTDVGLLERRGVVHSIARHG